MMIMAVILTDDNNDAWGSDNDTDGEDDEDDEDNDEDAKEQNWPVTIS